MDIIKKLEERLLKITLVHLFLVILSQVLLYKKELSPYLSRTIFSEGVLLEYTLRTVEILDQLPSIWYDI
ncbi:hypothetical protein BKP37_07600 [Anaerobacillus alkalilacustris]|uniref:Uncharacterized protein n=1 Tax=Anaerobacillus alkalilacustris TaxID=393763 RepID=A0A1S2LQP6_9BACI|nr:DUF5359 family protein [Anaerobacillus alkalilacustris]OIJ14832.1 hypothetical protein BKP37_07600 [Anaerobacillus alkalilacustris]